MMLIWRGIHHPGAALACKCRTWLSLQGPRKPGAQTATRIWPEEKGLSIMPISGSAEPQEH